MGHLPDMRSKTSVTVENAPWLMVRIVEVSPTSVEASSVRLAGFTTGSPFPKTGSAGVLNTPRSRGGAAGPLERRLPARLDSARKKNNIFKIKGRMAH